MIKFKNIYGIATFLVMSAHLLAQDKSFVLSGKLANVKTGSRIYLYYYTPKVHKDSATVKNGIFTFKGNLSSPIKAQLYLPHGIRPSKITLPLHGELDYLNLYLDEGLINVKGIDSVKNLVITNSQINKEDQQLSQILNVLQQKTKSLMSEFNQAPVEKRKNKAFIDSSNDKLKMVFKDIYAAKIQFAKDNPNSYVSLNTIFELARVRTTNYSTLDTVYDLLSERYKSSFLGSDTKKLLYTGLHISIGGQALDFTQPDANGKLHKLSDFKGKFVLLEFWASYCGPCRAENPNLVKAYNKYKDRNFTIIAVSLDAQRNQWLEAIKKDGLPYLQLSDLIGSRDNAAAALYGTEAIPESYLIDPSGKIIAKNLRGEVLNKKLSELFN